MFGRVYSVHDEPPSLSAAGRTQLYSPSTPPCTALRQLNARLLSLFTTLLRTLVDSTSASEASSDVAALTAAVEETFINMHHVINTLRPAQARRDIAALLHRQTAARIAAAAEITAACTETRQRIATARTELSRPYAPVSAKVREIAAMCAREKDAEISREMVERAKILPRQAPQPQALTVPNMGVDVALPPQLIDAHSQHPQSLAELERIVADSAL